MGNSNPVDPRLKIYIQTQKMFYNSGSMVEGVVFVDAEADFEFDALYIRVQGDEYCQWFEGSSKNRTKYTGNQNFYTQEHMLCRYHDKNFLQGKYSYPFSLQLSENIPGSFISSQHDAKIEYKLIAYFSNFDDHSKRQHCEVPLLIRQPFRQEPSEYEGSITKSPVSCWCLKQGSVYLKARFAKNVSLEGQRVKVTIEADNTDGKSPISNFVIELVQYTFLSSNSGVFRTFSKTIASQGAGYSVPTGQKIAPFNYEFTIPQEVSHQTAISTLVANYYQLEVFADIASISQDEPSIYCPIFIMKKKHKDVKQQDLRHKVHPDEFKLGAKKQIFKAPQYWFKKNKNLEVMNFRLEDGVGPESESDLML